MTRHSEFIVHRLPKETRAMTRMMHRSHRRGAAFTLIELMVVMAIIALMLTLLMSGVQRARVAYKRNAAHTEIRELGQGVTLFKQKLSVDFIPSKIVLREDGAYVLNSPDPVQNKLELDSLNWLKAAWPHLTFPVDWNQNNTTDTTPITLEGDQCLVFFLGGMSLDGNNNFNPNGQPSGFSVNKRNPMDRSTSERIGPFIQFQVDRLRDVRGNGFRSYIDPWKAQPYLYFTSYGKQAGYKATDATMGVTPYVDPATNKPKNADGFQIICAGEDKIFGSGGSNLPATGPGEDDIANFSQGTLGSGN
jgi:prepilin-type N-terminal cleavage/methylation domain-containing protein